MPPDNCSKGFPDILLFLLLLSGQFIAATAQTTATTTTKGLDCSYVECNGVCCYYGQLCRDTKEYGLACVFRDQISTITVSGTVLTTIRTINTEVLQTDTRSFTPPGSTSTITTSRTTSSSGSSASTTRPIFTGRGGEETTSATTSGSAQQSISPEDNPDGRNSRSQKSDKTPLIVGVVIGVFFGLLAILTTIFCLYRRRKRAAAKMPGSQGESIHEAPHNPFNPYPELNSTAIMEMQTIEPAIELAVPLAKAGDPFKYDDPDDRIKKQGGGGGGGSPMAGDPQIQFVPVPPPPGHYNYNHGFPDSPPVWGGGGGGGAGAGAGSPIAGVANGNGGTPPGAAVAWNPVAVQQPSRMSGVTVDGDAVGRRTRPESMQPVWSPEEVVANVFRVRRRERESGQAWPAPVAEDGGGSGAAQR